VPSRAGRGLPEGSDIVIKMAAIDGIPVVKLSDDAGKALGDPEALQVVKWIFREDPAAS
jgi:nicotinic acid phosphoribosyltransferase